jgi:hypothetical protein
MDERIIIILIVLIFGAMECVNFHSDSWEYRIDKKEVIKLLREIIWVK